MIAATAPAFFLALLGFALGATACVFLVTGHSRRRAWNAPLLAALALLSLREFAFVAEKAGWAPHAVVAFLAAACLFLFWPAHLLYVERARSGGFTTRRTALLVSPALVASIVLLLSTPERRVPLVHGIPGVLLMTVYAVFALHGGWRRPSQEDPVMSPLKQRWLRLWSAGAAIIPAMTLLTIVFGPVIPGLRDVAGLLHIAAEVAFLEIVVPAALLNSRVLSECGACDEATARPFPAPAQAAVIKKRVVEYMGTGQPYRNPDLRISAVATAIGVLPHVLSSVINREFNLNFADFVNGYRIREAQRLLLDPERRQYTILAVALEVGFASKAPFNRAFKRVTGLTPSEFQRQNVQASSGSG